MNNQKRTKLIKTIQNRPTSQNERLHELRIEGIEIQKKQDWLWHLLLSSMSTMGNSRGYEGLIMNTENYRLVAYENLLKLEEASRFNNLTSALGNAKVRRYRNKATWLNNNFTFIEACGGLKVIQELLLQTQGIQSKLKLMQIFDGIGQKYARNIFMDLNHPDFESSIAIDERILDVSEALEIDSGKLSYADHEQIFVLIAREAGITPWTLDRLLYNFTKYYLNAIEDPN